MSYGDGSLREVFKKNGASFSPKKWRICLSFMQDVVQEDGSIKKERKRVVRYTQGTKAQAKEFRDELSSQYDKQGNLRSEIELEIEKQKKVNAMTLTKLIELWDAARKTAGTASERTLKENRNSLKHVERHLGDTPIEQINAQMIEMAYAAIREERGLSGTTLNHIHILLKNVFQKAIDYDLIYKNPCAHVVAPKRNKPKRKSLNMEQGAKLLKKIDEAEEAEYKTIEEKETRRQYREDHGIAKDRNAFRGLHIMGCIMAVRIGLATGMRRGEVFGLTWNNVDLEKKIIRVCQSATSKLKIKSTKTDAGSRVIAIDDTTVSHLAKWKKLQGEYLVKIFKKQTDETPVCCSDTGGLYSVDNFESWWDGWRKANGFKTLKFHELRHTQATQLLANGVDVKTVQTRLGHANASITLGWYAHAIPEKDHEAAALIGNLFAKKADEDSEQESHTQTADSSELAPQMAPDSQTSTNGTNMAPTSISLLETKQASKFEIAC